MQLLKVIEQEWTNTGIIHRFNKCTSNVIFALIYIYDIGYFDIFATFKKKGNGKGNGTRVNK